MPAFFGNLLDFFRITEPKEEEQPNTNVLEFEKDYYNVACFDIKDVFMYDIFFNISEWSYNEKISNHIFYKTDKFWYFAEITFDIIQNRKIYLNAFSKKSENRYKIEIPANDFGNYGIKFLSGKHLDKRVELFEKSIISDYLMLMNLHKKFTIKESNNEEKITKLNEIFVN